MQGLVLSNPPGGFTPPNLQPAAGANVFPNPYGYQIFGMPSFPGSSGPASLTPLETPVVGGNGSNGGGGGGSNSLPPVLRLRSRALPPAPRRPRSRPPTRDRPKATRRRTRRRSKETPTLSVNTFRVKTVESSLDPLWRKFSNPGLERRCVVIRKNIAACSCPYSLHASVPCCAP